MNAGIYNQLLRINQAHAEIVAALAVLRKYPAFDATTLDHFAALWKETRAATNSYLAGAIQPLYRKPTVPSSTLGGYVIRGIAGTTVVF